MKALKKLIYPYLIDQKWKGIHRRRKAIKKALASGTPTTSEQLIQLGQSITHLGRQAFSLREQYEQLL